MDMILESLIDQMFDEDLDDNLNNMAATVVANDVLFEDYKKFNEEIDWVKAHWQLSEDDAINLVAHYHIMPSLEDIESAL